jgi:hypothetical protein
MSGYWFSVYPLRNCLAKYLLMALSDLCDTGFVTLFLFDFQLHFNFMAHDIVSVICSRIKVNVFLFV